MKLMDQKLKLIDATADMEIESVVDLGGMWGVGGGYLLAAIGKHDATGMEVDFNADLPAVENHKGDFTEWLKNRSNLDGWARFDMCLLFDVLLHQLCPMEVLRNVTDRCRQAILISQPCLTDKIPISVNLQGMSNSDWETAYDMEKRDVYATARGRSSTWGTATWGWGQSASWVLAAMKLLGWSLDTRTVTVEDEPEGKWCRAAMLFLPNIVT